MKTWKKVLIIMIPIVLVSAASFIAFFGGRQNKKIQYECNDGEEIIYSPLLEENISDENGLKYVNNEILVYIDSYESKKALEEYLNSINAKIVGQIPQINQYQIQLSDEMSLEKIQNIVSEMEQISWINHVGVNYVIETEEEFYPNDKEWKKSWKEQSGGKNWGMEAIKAPEAWEYCDKMNPVNVGVFDTVFDTDHEDLKDVFVEEPLLNFSSKENKEGNQSHGTHVAGTIAAGFNNEIGVCGVCPTARLYGVAFESKLKNKYTTSQFFNVGFTYLITNNCKVINMSLTPTNRIFNFSASRGNEYANNIINEISDEMGYFLDIMIKEGYKFVICNSSGNLNEANGGYHFYRKEKFDDKKELSYYDDDDYKSYKDGKADETVKKYFDKYGDSRVESGNVDAKYNSICAIKNKNVRDIIITVGAIEPNEKDKKGNIQNYKESAYSQGGEAVDVVAPGGSISIEKDAIYSTVPNGYGYSQGTSMATPHVSGVAAMIFALDPDIEPSKVKEIIVETASDQYGSGEHKYGLVDANAAAQKTLGITVSDKYLQKYIPFVEEALMNSDEIKFSLGGNRGALYDVNNDGIQEMILVYDAMIYNEGSNLFPAKVLDIYSVNEDDAVTLLENLPIFYYAGGGFKGNVCIGEKDSKKYILFNSGSSHVSGYNNGLDVIVATANEGKFKTYSLEESELKSVDNIDYRYFEDENKNVLVSDATINEELKEYDEYITEKDKYKVVYNIFDSDNDASDAYTLQALLEYLKSKSKKSEEKEEIIEDEIKDNWKKKYIDKISTDNELGEPNNNTYQLIDIDGAEPPELYINGICEASGSKIITFFEDTINEQILSRLYGLIYEPGTGYFINENGNMDYYEDKVYKLEAGGFTNIHNGNFNNGDNRRPLIDKDTGEYLYYYYWEGEEISVEEYKNNLSQYIKNPHYAGGEKNYTLNEMIDIIEHY